MELASQWFLWAIISLLLQGIQAFFSKKLVEDGGDIATASVVMPAVITGLAAITVMFESRPVGDDLTGLVMLAGIQGVLYFLTTAMRLEALHTKIPAYVVFPIVKSSVVFIVIMAAFLFDEWASLREPKQAGGIILAVTAMYLLLEWRRNIRSGGFDKGISYAVLAMLASGGAALLAKYTFVAIGEVSIFAFILISNATNLLLAGLMSRRSASPVSRQSYAIGVRSGVMMGLAGFGGLAAFLQAIQYGNLSVVASINALTILIPVLLSAWLYSERLTARKLVAVLFSIIALVLMVQT